MRYRVHAADVQFERGQWVSRWVRGRTMEMEAGRISDKGKWLPATEKMIEKWELVTDIPVRFQVVKLILKRHREMMARLWKYPRL